MAGFLDLPVELRCNIYKQLLKSNYLIRLIARSGKTKNGKLYDRFEYAGQQEEIADISSDLLLANKLIYTEVAPVLYTINRFSFDNARHLKSFLLRIGPLAQHLREITYRSAVDKDTLQDIIYMLKQAKYLTKLNITDNLTDSCGWARPRSAEWMLKLFKPLLQVLSTTRKNEFVDEKRSIADVISIQPAIGFANWPEQIEAAKSLDEEVKALVLARYG